MQEVFSLGDQDILEATPENPEDFV